MPVVNNSSLREFNLPGLNHRTFAGPEHGMKNLEVWGQVIEAGPTATMFSAPRESRTRDYLLRGG